MGGLTRNVVFFVAAAMAVFLLTTSLATAWMPLTRTLRGFEGQAVDVLLWGAPPPDLPARGRGRPWTEPRCTCA